MDRRYGRIVYKDFSGGMILDEVADASGATAENRHRLEPNQLSLAQNVIIRPDGRIASRCGIQAITGTLSDADFRYPTLCLSYDQGSSTGSFLEFGRCIYAKGAGHVATYGAGWVKETTGGAVKLNCGVNFQGPTPANNGLFFGGLAGIYQFEPVAGSWPALPTVTTITRVSAMAVHANRVFAASLNAPSVLQACVIGDPTDWASVGSFSAAVGGQHTRIVGLASLDDELYVFCNDGIWLLSGQTTDSFRLDRLTPDGGMSVVVESSGHATDEVITNPSQNRIAIAEMAGFGRAVLFIDNNHQVRAVNRSGIVTVARGFGPLTIQATSLAYSPDSGIALVRLYSFPYATNPLALAINCQTPTRIDGDLAWAVSLYTYSSINGTPWLFVAEPFQNTSGSRFFKQFLILGEYSELTKYIQTSIDDTAYIQKDDYVGTTTKTYYRVPVKIRIRPEDAGTMLRKRWTRASVRINTPAAEAGAVIGNMTGNAYYNRTLTGPTALTLTPAKDMAVTLNATSEFLQLELSLFDTASGDTDQPKHYVEVDEIVLEFEARD